MLEIRTDLQDTSWLAYILEEFARIQGAQFQFRIRPLSQDKGEGAVLYYARTPSAGPTIPQRADILPREVSWLDEKTFLLAGTSVKDPGGFLVAGDILWNSFVFLSRLEEYRHAANGRQSHSYAGRHPRKDTSTFGVPIVNTLFSMLERSILGAFPYLKFGKGAPAMVDFSHDVDYLERTPQLLLKQGVRSLAQGDIPEFLRLCKNKASYRLFDYWRTMEKSAGIRSVFYVYAATPRKMGLRDRLIDPSYDLLKDQELRSTINLLSQEGFGIGLHGSFASAGDPRLLKAEKDALCSCLGKDVTRTRQHWLHYLEDTTPYCHEPLFRFDSSLGWNDIPGFRSGCCSAYRPYDHKGKRAFLHYEIPLVLMDSHLFYGVPKGALRPLERARELMRRAWEMKNAHMSICWHVRGCSPAYGWHTVYEALAHDPMHL